MMKKITFSMLLAFVLVGSIAFAQMNEMSPTFSKTNKSTKAQFDVLHSFSTTVGGEQAVETDGTYLYTAKWSADGLIKKYDLTGQLLDSFAITGVAAGIRDLCYDGTYFYGRAGASGTSIYQMDFDNKTLVSTISLGSNVRHLSYDPTLDGGNGGFWTGDWAELASHKKDGSLISAINVPAGFESNYGSSFDFSTPGGPYLWFFSQDGNGVDLVQYDIGTNAIVSTHDCSSLTGIGAEAIAGGLGTSTTLVPGTFVLIINVQQTPNFVAVLDMGPAGTIGIEEPTETTYQLFPNPAKTNLFIEADAQINEAVVYNAVGQVVENFRIDAKSHTLNTSNYQPGIYFINLNTENGATTRKFVVSE